MRERSPDLSVVMAVHNGSTDLVQTIASIQAQTHQNLEFVIVDDGSTDETPTILERAAASDYRVRLLNQPKSGLTQALIRGCSEVRGPVIARQDAGDLSHPERIATALDAFRDSGVVLWASEVEYFGPEGEPLYTTSHSMLGITESLLADPLERISGLPHHGSAVFRARAYAEAGGYRRQFWFAQDLDLWLRLARLGRVLLEPTPLYQASISTGSISSMHRAEQIALARVILKIRDADDSLVQADLLREAEQIRPDSGRGPGRRQRARAAYFIGSLLASNRDARARRYFLQAVRANPLLLRAWYRLLRAL